MMMISAVGGSNHNTSPVTVCIKIIDFALKMMYFVLKMMDFALKMMYFVLKMMYFVFNMMTLMQLERQYLGSSRRGY